ncbi:hypothetical protein DPMN_056363 [Dreissena polymorpha]|uniref:Uncharacterized protein n=1 Tax=Dreissena polymorpha TaxID=45954 RepID=A0A9D4CTB0_DREPO|nr:hypothetical protein DPMN_056363 [Dreissena polymorpha]
MDHEIPGDHRVAGSVDTVSRRMRLYPNNLASSQLKEQTLPGTRMFACGVSVGVYVVNTLSTNHDIQVGVTILFVIRLTWNAYTPCKGVVNVPVC